MEQDSRADIIEQDRREEIGRLQKDNREEIAYTVAGQQRGDSKEQGS